MYQLLFCLIKIMECIAYLHLYNLIIMNVFMVIFEILGPLQLNTRLNSKSHFHKKNLFNFRFFKLTVHEKRKERYATLPSCRNAQV
jgi:hypothetical protein